MSLKDKKHNKRKRTAKAIPLVTAAGLTAIQSFAFATAWDGTNWQNFINNTRQTERANTQNLITSTHNDIPTSYTPAVYNPHSDTPSSYIPAVYSPHSDTPSSYTPSRYSAHSDSPGYYTPSVYSPHSDSPGYYTPSRYSAHSDSPGYYTPSVYSPHSDTPGSYSAHSDTPASGSSHSDTPAYTNSHSDTPGYTTPAYTNSHSDTPGYSTPSSYSSHSDSWYLSGSHFNTGPAHSPSYTPSRYYPHSDAGGSGHRSVYYPAVYHPHSDSGGSGHRSVYYPHSDSGGSGHAPSYKPHSDSGGSGHSPSYTPHSDSGPAHSPSYTPGYYTPHGDSGPAHSPSYTPGYYTPHSDSGPAHSPSYTPGYYTPHSDSGGSGHSPSYTPSSYTPHSDSGGSGHSPSYTPSSYTPHSDSGGVGHAPAYTAASYVPHTDIGINHQNYVPSKPGIFSVAQNEKIKGVVRIGLYSYDKNYDGSGSTDANSKTAQYDLQIRKVKNIDGTANTSSWVTLFSNQVGSSNDTGYTYDFNTVDPLKTGNTNLNASEGYYELKAIAKNTLSTPQGNVVQQSPDQIITVIIQQNQAPEITVQNTSELINFTFGYDGALNPTNVYKKYVDGLYTGLASSKTDGILVRVSMKDADKAGVTNQNWQKGKAYIVNSSGTTIVPAQDILWDDKNTPANLADDINKTTSEGATKAGYVFFSRDSYATLGDVKNAKIVVEVTDYLDINCTQQAGTTVSQNTVSLTDTTQLIVNIDVQKPIDPVINLSTTANTPGPITVTITYAPDAKYKSYEIVRGGTVVEAKDYTGPITLTRNATIRAASADALYNWSNPVSKDVTNITGNVPQVTVTNSSEINGFTFGLNGALSPTNVYKTYASGLYAGATASQKDGILVKVSMKDADKSGVTLQNWQKGKVYVTNSAGTVISSIPAVDIIWDSTGNTIVSSENADKTGYAFIPKASYTGIGDITGAKIVAEVMDYFDSACADPTNAPGKQTATINIDVTEPALPIISSNRTGYSPDPLTVTINYPADAVVKSYTIERNGVVVEGPNPYTVPIILDRNAKVIASCQDKMQYWSGNAVLDVINIQVIPEINDTMIVGKAYLGQTLAVSATGKDIASGKYRIFYTNMVNAPDISDVENPASGWKDSTIAGDMILSGSTGLSVNIPASEYSKIIQKDICTYMTVKVWAGSETNNGVQKFTTPISTTMDTADSVESIIGYVGHNQVITVDKSLTETENIVVSRPNSPISTYGPYSYANILKDNNFFIDGDILTYRLEFDVLKPASIKDMKIGLDFNSLNSRGISLDIFKSTNKLSMELYKMNLTGGKWVKDSTTSRNYESKYTKEKIDGYTETEYTIANTPGRSKYTVDLNPADVSSGGRYVLEYTVKLNVEPNSVFEDILIRNEASIDIYTENSLYGNELERERIGRRAYIDTRVAKNVYVR